MDNNKSHAVKPIPTDCIKCNEIRYGGSGRYADFAVCHIIDMGDYGYTDPSFILFRFKKDKPQIHTPPTWCPLKVKEPEKTYPIEVKRRSIHDTIAYFVNLYSGEELQVEEFRKSLVDLLTTYFEISLQDKELSGRKLKAGD